MMQDIMTKTAWVFPGQGSQKVGMGVDLKDTAIAKSKLAVAETILGWSILDICQGDEETLGKTFYTQPCLYAIEAILVNLLEEKGQQPSLVAGHSLGEYAALYAAGVFDFASGLRLVKKRAELMDKAAGGKMAALMKFDRPLLERAIANTQDVVLANDNSEGQVVISGSPEAVDAVLDEVKAKRAVPLKVSGAFHSHLMKDASQQFQEVLDKVDFQDATVPVLSNVAPTCATKADELKERLRQQMTGSVRWREIVLQLPQEGIDRVVEIGPSNVLTGLIARTCANIELKNVGGLESLQDF
jgi:[acyl-carrier-protein] S-malonyltransferase